jgi:ribosomal protein L40E
MLRAVLARLRMWFDLLIGTVGPRIRQTRLCPACGQRISKRALKCRSCGTWRPWGDPW